MTFSGKRKNCNIEMIVLLAKKYANRQAKSGEI